MVWMFKVLYDFLWNLHVINILELFYIYTNLIGSINDLFFLLIKSINDLLIQCPQWIDNQSFFFGPIDNQSKIEVFMLKLFMTQSCISNQIIIIMMTMMMIYQNSLLHHLIKYFLLINILYTLKFLSIYIIIQWHYIILCMKYVLK